jgi:hypothetical protein
MMGSFLVALNALSLLIGIHLLKRSLKNVSIYSRILQEAENLEDDTIKELANAKIPEGITMDDVHKYVRKEADMVKFNFKIKLKEFTKYTFYNTLLVLFNGTMLIYNMYQYGTFAKIFIFIVRLFSKIIGA